MNDTKDLLERQVSGEEHTRSLDSVAPANRMRAVDAAMKRYFESDDWLRERNKLFPGRNQHRFRQART